MLSYPINEAEELLSTKLKTAKTSLSNCEEDLDFLREQITVGHDSDHRTETRLTMHGRRWRSLRLESTTGKLYKRERTRMTPSRTNQMQERTMILPMTRKRSKETGLS